MNKTAIKNFAIWARNKLIADIGYRAGLMGITEKGIADALPQSTLDAEFYDIGAAEPYLVAGDAIKQRQQLVAAIREKKADTDYKTAYRYIIEEVAYTWFNRLIAVRFMEVNDYLPSHLRVLSSESGKVEPDLVTTPFDADLPFTAEEEARILQWKQDNKLDELFRFLFIRQCNALNEILPGLFEKTTDYTELLLNLSVVDREGVVYKLTHDIPENDFNVEQGGQVEIIGWLYQYYNTEPKAAAFAKNGKITKEEIPAVTQLFTPDWIVRYMVENSLGRLWLEGHPDSSLKENWKYYLDEAPQEPQVQAKLADIRKDYAALAPEDIRLIDPCMGSGHILVYAFDVLMQIYTSVGYSERDAAKCILEHNLYGLDIDDRAYQLAYFAVMMKARQYNRRILNGENTCHIYAIQESNTVNRAHLKYFGAGLDDLEKNTARMQLEGLLDTLTDAKEYGSILNVPEYNWALLRRFVAGINDEAQVSFESAGVEENAEQLQQLIDLGETMARKYWVTVTNPPYAGAAKLDDKVNKFIKDNYADSKADLFSVFIEKGNAMVKQNGFNCMVTMQSWMFLSSFEKMRIKLLQTKTIATLMHMENMVMGIAFGTAVAVFRNCHIADYKGTYNLIKYTDIENDMPKEFPVHGNRFAQVNSDNFAKIPGSPVAYWVHTAGFKAFDAVPFSKRFVSGGRNKTHNNEKYVRYWWEISNTEKWKPYSNGGEYRKWYGNNIDVVDWSESARNSYASHGGLLQEKYWSVPAITWNDITSGPSSYRVKPKESAFSSVSPTIICNSQEYDYTMLAFLNSTVCEWMNQISNPTMHTLVGNILLLPDKIKAIDASKQAKNSIALCRKDWDSFETSWDFTCHPLIKAVTKYPHQMDIGNIYLCECYDIWAAECEERFARLKANEEELNRIFIDIYGLQDELTPEVEDKDVTVRRADLTREIKSLLSYAVGCMFGRYSTYKDGLLFAGKPYSLKAFVDKLNEKPGTISEEEVERAYHHEGAIFEEMFFPDEDNVIPITDEEYLDDDIVARLYDWLKVVYGVDTLEANLDYIARALGNKGSTSREIIRNYFVNDFFKDHCQTYSVTGSGKRPIYWLFDSGKQNGFKALVYLHRYTPDTIGTLRVDYLHKMQRVYESEINRMQDTIDHSANAREAAAAAKRKDKLTKQLKECRDYDEKISHLALSRIALDLDDGVKVNYRKLQTANDGKFYEVLADSKNIMAKEKK